MDEHIWENMSPALHLFSSGPGYSPSVTAFFLPPKSPENLCEGSVDVHVLTFLHVQMYCSVKFL